MPISRTPSQSRYRQGTWTVTKLKDELRNRNLSPMGTKPELIDRLEKADHHYQEQSSSNSSSEGDDNYDDAADTDTGSMLKAKRGRSLSKGEESPAIIRGSSRSPERETSSMTVYELRTELRHLGYSPNGKKLELVKRLEEAQASTNPFVDSFSATTESKGHHSPSQSGSTNMKSSPSPSSGSEKKRKIKGSGLTADDIGLLTSPITTIMLAIRGFWSLGSDALSKASRTPLLYINGSALIMLIIGINLLDGPHQEFLKPIQEIVMWHGRWLILGILSSIGLGTGAHTFLLFLGPFIARVTTAAYVCKTLDFPLYGHDSLLCPAIAYQKGDITLWMILNKVKWAFFSWGLGTAIGELPPYLIARATASTGVSSGQVNMVEEIAAKPRKSRTWTEAAQLVTHSVVSRLGFFGILLCASIPNPLFDVAGITCGYFMIPFKTFASATFLGKAVIKATIQSAFVILLFSRDYLEYSIKFVQNTLPEWGKPFHEWILAQRTVFQERTPDPIVGTIGSVWHGFLMLMMGYFFISVLRSIAIMQAQRESRLKSLR